MTLERQNKRSQKGLICVIKKKEREREKEKNGFYSEGVGGAEIYEAKTEMTGF